MVQFEVASFLGEQEGFLAESILSPNEGLEMTTDEGIVITNKERDLSQTEPLPVRELLHFFGNTKTENFEQLHGFDSRLKN